MAKLIFCVGLLILGLSVQQAHAQGIRARRQANNDNNSTRQNNSTSPRAARNGAANSNNVPQQNNNTRNALAAPGTVNNAASGGQFVRGPNGTQIYVPSTQTQGIPAAQPRPAMPTLSNGPAIAPQVAEPNVVFDSNVTNGGPPQQSVMKVPTGTPGAVGPTRGLEENVIPFQTVAITIANPATTRGPVKFTINGEAVTLPAGKEISFDNKPTYVIEFTRGGGQGKMRYTLAAGKNYNFTVAATGWDLSLAPADDVAPAAPVAPPGASLESLNQLPMPPVPGIR